MTLEDYITKEGRGALSRLAAAAGTSKGYLHDLINNPKRKPSVKMAQALEAATGGKVSAISLLGLERRKQKQGAQ
jgi:hypothetical protein